MVYILILWAKGSVNSNKIIQIEQSELITAHMVKKETKPMQLLLKMIPLFPYNYIYKTYVIKL